MLTKRLIACFDIRDKMVTKAHKFQNNIDIDRADVIAEKIYADQIDEIIFFDILASAEKRKIDLDTVRMVAERVSRSRSAAASATSTICTRCSRPALKKSALTPWRYATHRLSTTARLRLGGSALC